MNPCVVQSIIVAFILVSIVALMCSSTAKESYEPGRFDPEVLLPPTVSFLERRQCYFPPPDYGQFSYAGCRCSRVGTKMHNGVVDRQNSGLYTFPR